MYKELLRKWKNYTQSFSEKWRTKWAGSLNITFLLTKDNFWTWYTTFFWATGQVRKEEWADKVDIYMYQSAKIISHSNTCIWNWESSMKDLYKQREKTVNKIVKNWTWKKPHISIFVQFNNDMPELFIYS